MSPFTPAGDRARWRVLYDVLDGLDVGDTVTYDQLADELDLDPAKDLRTVQLAMRRAAKELLEVNHRAVANVPGSGYRIVEPVEHLGLARRHQVRARRSVTRARGLIENVDWSKIQDPEVKRALELAGHALVAQDDMMRRVTIRQNYLESTLAETATKVERTDEETTELRDRLAKLEQEFRARNGGPG